jgi:hypothetical protein
LEDVKMKLKTTFKELQNGAGDRLVSLGYCELQHLLECAKPFAYVASPTYGWRCDAYTVGAYTLLTGYGTGNAPRLAMPWRELEELERIFIKYKNAAAAAAGGDWRKHALKVKAMADALLLALCENDTDAIKKLVATMRRRTTVVNKQTKGE